ncbi:hypothetical protein BUALT_Bualt03G0032900 [Buddleja alternifolia]|uniref:GBF-interacting protein 1 N-terminal domain-containing protein n=1 Tax=Buddleja alternifolia TaxID=168488 RepID=A0AAV6Y1L8_9LAMI|nr:hypothetical protein BUALT_Bualt03G0032900 [Buddleja alternifolia]
MSTSRGSGAGNGGGVQPIPAGSRKMVQSLKEIVNCSDAEIYATLKDCNMDPNEAVNRLLTQDPFHEVKSKREKKKEGKDTTEPRSRGANNSSRGGGKTGADRYLGRGGSTPYNFSESAPLHGKSSYKKENGSNAYYGSNAYSSSLSSVPGMSGNNRSRGPPDLSDVGHAENKGSSFGTADVIPSSIHQPSGYQSTWVGVPGQVSMADIVKMGRPHNKAPNASHNSRFPEDHESGVSSVQQSTIDEWPSIEKPAPTKVVSVPEYTVDSEQHPEAPGVLSESVDQLSEEDEVREIEDDDIENSEANDVGSVSIASRKIPEDDSGGASLFENDLYKNMGSYQPQVHDFEHHEVEEVGASVSSVTRNLQQLSVNEDDRELPSEGYPSVVIPDHLQVQNADCSHLSFGSFGSAMNSAYSPGTMTSAPGKTNFEEPHSEADISSAGHQETRSSEYYVDDSLRNASDGGLFHRTGANAGNYDPSSASQPEELKPENAEMPHGNQYPFPSSNPGYNFDDAQQLNAAFSQTSSQMQNLAPFPNVMQYPNSLPSTLSAANAHPTRESDLQYSQFPLAQSMSAKYGNAASSIGGSALSMSEALKTAGLSSSQPAGQTLPGTSVATGPPLPQHLAVHPYSQPTLPLGPFANMISYPFLPQSYTYMPSAFQQAFAGNNTYHQSLAAVLPQYKNSVSASSLPQSAAVASGYGAFGNTATIPGNFSMNPPAAPSGTTLSYDDVLSSQYKDNSHLVSLQQQQNENAAMWLHGANSRTMSAVPASTYYNYQGQSQQPGGFRQGQQPSQNYGGALGYPNFYHSQTGISLDQQQNPRDGSLGSSQGQPKQSQIWQNGY